ncbi:MAG: hypothetical protein GX892_05740 [Thermoanaerobacteraceae bacterium]|nr:hypothetical protein [Thermoanaerobacteraceae bacterium]
MKKILVLLLVLVFFFSVSGCGVKKKIENKIGEAIGEKIIEGATGQKVDVDGDQVTIKGEDGSFTIGGGQWPDNDLVKNIPEFRDGKIEGVMSSEETVAITIEEVEQRVFENYLANIKKSFTRDTYELTTNEIISYSGANEKGINVQLSYDMPSKSMIIAVGKQAE